MYKGDIHAKGICVLGDIHTERTYTYMEKPYIWGGILTRIRNTYGEDIKIGTYT